MKLFLRNILTLAIIAIATVDARDSVRYRRKHQVGRATRGRNKSKADKGPERHLAHYMADLGEYGNFKMSVHSDGKVTYDVTLANVDWVTASELTWHLHSGKVGPGAANASNGTATACDANYTAGHYDPMLKCGSASTAQECSKVGTDVPCCLAKPATDYCTNANIGTCEVGDLSGLYGKLAIVDNKGSKIAEGLCPDCIAHFDPKASATDGTAAYNTWNSIVFHGTKDSPGARVLCADVIRV